MILLECGKHKSLFDRVPTKGYTGTRLSLNDKTITINDKDFDAKYLCAWYRKRSLRMVFATIEDMETILRWAWKQLYTTPINGAHWDVNAIYISNMFPGFLEVDVTMKLLPSVFHFKDGYEQITIREELEESR